MKELVKDGRRAVATREMRKFTMRTSYGEDWEHQKYDEYVRLCLDSCRSIDLVFGFKKKRRTRGFHGVSMGE